MKVCLVANNSLRVSPYVRKYSKLLDEMGVEYDIISKEHIREKATIESCNNIFFYDDKKTPIGKFMRFIDYAKFVKRKIKTSGYDKVVFFTGMNAAFAYFVFGKYMKKEIEYILDIRDYDKSFTNKLMSRYLKSSVRNAKAVVISSARFKNWLPKSETIYVMHNLPNDSVKKDYTKAFCNDVVRIGYLGGVGYFEQNKYLVDSLENNGKYMLTFRGVYPSGYNIRDYCCEKNIKNVEFHGKYTDDEKEQLYDDIDVINAVYGNNSLIVTTALPNKLYDCAYYKIPIMVSQGTYLSELVEEYALGFSISTQDDSLRNTIEKYISNFDRIKFESGCKAFLEFVEAEQDETDKRIKSFFASGGK